MPRLTLTILHRKLQARACRFSAILLLTASHALPSWRQRSWLHCKRPALRLRHSTPLPTPAPQTSPTASCLCRQADSLDGWERRVGCLCRSCSQCQQLACQFRSAGINSATLPAMNAVQVTNDRHGPGRPPAINPLCHKVETFVDAALNSCLERCRGTLPRSVYVRSLLVAALQGGDKVQSDVGKVDTFK